MTISHPFQLLEINVISAQDLEAVSKRKMKTYATARVNPSRKLTGSVDTEGHNNPTWNEKFVFKVDEEFLRQDTSAVMIEIFAVNWLRDSLVGTVRVLVGNLIPPNNRNFQNGNNIGMRFAAVQIRRPSGRPQGILNIGVALLDSSMRSMPLYRQMSASAVGYRHLMDHQHHDDSINKNSDNDNDKKITPVKPILRRSKSERSERVTFENTSIANSSIVAIAHKKPPPPVLTRESSILSISDVGYPFMKKTTKASSVISGAEFRERPKQNKGKSGSILSDSVFSKESMASKHFMNENNVKPKEKEVNHANKKEEVALPPPPPPHLVEEKPRKANGRSAQKFIPYEYPKPNQKWTPMTDSEVGPSPSEVAAAMAEKRYPLEDAQSSIVDDWSVDESVEGLRSKMDRWRTELPPIYDQGGYASSYKSSSVSAPRRRSETDTGLFSCFGNIFGYECQCVCGKPRGKKYPKRYRQSPSIGSRSFL